MARLIATATCSWTIAKTSGRPTGGGVKALGVDELGGPVELLLPAGPDEEEVAILDVGGERHIVLGHLGMADR